MLWLESNTTVLSKANLSKAVLSKAILSKAILSKTILSKTILHKSAQRVVVTWLFAGLLSVLLSLDIVQASARCQSDSEAQSADTPDHACVAKITEKVLRPKPYKPYQGNYEQLLHLGERLFNDVTLGPNGLACRTCHAGGALFQASFSKPYPHRVGVPAEMLGISRVYLDEMIQLCLVQPMQGKPLKWKSKKLAALTAYMAKMQQEAAFEQ